MNILYLSQLSNGVGIELATTTKISQWLIKLGQQTIVDTNNALHLK